jgi:hypothetical protein
MAQNQTTITVTDAEYTQITNDDVTTISFQILKGSVYVRLTSDTTQPAATLLGWRYEDGEGESFKPLAQIVAASSARVWVRSATLNDAIVQVDHA